MLLYTYSHHQPEIHFIAACQDGFIVPHVWEIRVRKNLTIFKGCHFAQFHILIWWSFPEIETKNFNSDPCFLKLLKMGTISPAAHFLNFEHIGRSQTIAAIICGFSCGERLVKLKSYEELPWKADAEAYLCYYSSFPTLVFYRL